MSTSKCNAVFRHLNSVEPSKSIRPAWPLRACIVVLLTINKGVAVHEHQRYRQSSMRYVRRDAFFFLSLRMSSHLFASTLGSTPQACFIHCHVQIDFFRISYFRISQRTMHFRSQFDLQAPVAAQATDLDLGGMDLQDEGFAPVAERQNFGKMLLVFGCIGSDFCN